MAKWPNHLNSDKQFHKRPNGNPDERDREREIDSSKSVHMEGVHSAQHCEISQKFFSQPKVIQCLSPCEVLKVVWEEPYIFQIKWD